LSADELIQTRKGLINIVKPEEKDLHVEKATQNAGITLLMALASSVGGLKF
jgi:hypothetical protein